jgi:hypothetical protein
MVSIFFIGTGDNLVDFDYGDSERLSSVQDHGVLAFERDRNWEIHSV